MFVNPLTFVEVLGQGPERVGQGEWPRSTRGFPLRDYRFRLPVAGTQTHWAGPGRASGHRLPVPALSGQNPDVPAARAAGSEGGQAAGEGFLSPVLVGPGFNQQLSD